jgi:hypothetical protein
MKKRRVLLFYQHYSTFVREDDLILRQHFEVEQYCFNTSKKITKFGIQLLRQVFFCVVKAPFIDVIYIWFADYHSFFPSFIGKVLRKKVIVVVGGYDAVYIPEIDFGVFRRKNIRAWCAKKTYEFSSLILPVDESLVYSENSYADPSGIGIKVGITHFVKNISHKIQVIPTGYDSNFWKNSSDEKEKSVVTIAGAGDFQTFRRKGLDFLIEIAELLPHVRFNIIGLKSKFTTANDLSFPKNVFNHGYVAYHKLPAVISKYKVFAQFSLSEGLPNSLCEAMLCECIPVGSNVNGIPRGINDNGFILPVKDAKLGAQLIKNALESDESLGRNARNHIKQNFPIKLRSDKLIRAINRLFIQ